MSVPPIDPCAEAARLRTLLTAMSTGESVALTRFGEDEVRFHKGDPARLERLIAEYDRACAIQTGTLPRRTRFAKRAAFRPY